MTCRSRSWSNRVDIVEQDLFLSWDIYVGKYPIMGAISPESTSTSGKKKAIFLRYHENLHVLEHRLCGLSKSSLW